jgi:hypothetical protein
MVTGAYKPRNPKASALYQCVQTHFAAFEANYARGIRRSTVSIAQ